MSQLPVRSPRSVHQVVALAIGIAGALACTTTPDPEPESPAQAVTNETAASETPPKAKLPTHTTPLSYVIDLKIDPAKERFEGKVDIEVELAEPRQVIWMHGASLEVTQAEISTASSPVVLTAEQVTEQGLLKLTAPEPVAAGRATISVRYTAAFDKDLKGLYRVTQKDPKSGDEVPYVFTQFEPTAARFCFPSFDEPRFKVPYRIVVTAPADMTVIATTPEVGQKPVEGGQVQHDFGTTKPLPTYLLALAVGPFDVVETEGIPANEVRTEVLPFRGVATRGNGEKLAYALKNTAPVLAELERYYGRPYPFEKLDIIAVPDFAFGAMENVGAVTFRDWLLLVDEQTAPLRQKRAFTGVMAHELAHMWFGNLVTMPWWDDIWLNEAFATWMGHKVMHRVDPSYDAPVSMVERVHGAMSTDALVAARQIRQPIESDHDILNAFDSITYSKGGGVLSMFERYLGEEVFRDGIRRYMKKHAYNNATYSDLLAALEEASGKKVGEAFETFLFQPGVPLVDADLVCTEGQNASLSLAQERYFPAGSTGEKDKLWKIPVCARFGTGRKTDEACTLLEEKTGSLDLGPGCPAWVMPNADAAGYYRWTLPADDLARLDMPAPHSRGRTGGKKAKKAAPGRGRTQVAVPPKLTVKEWLSVANAVGAGFSTNRLDTGASLQRLAPLAGHPHRAVATAPLNILGFVVDKLSTDENKERIQANVRELYRPVWARLGPEAKPGENADTRSLRARVARTLLVWGADQDVSDQLAPMGHVALGMGDEGGKLKAPDPDLAEVAAAAAVRAYPDAFDAALELLKTEQDPVKRSVALSALPLSTDPAQQKRYRELALDDRLRGNEVARVIFGGFQLPEFRVEAWDFVQTRYEDLAARLPTHRKGSMPWVGSGLCDKKAAEDVEAFFRPKVQDLMGGPRNLDGSVEAIRLCATRVEMQRPSAERFFAGPKASAAGRASR